MNLSPGRSSLLRFFQLRNRNKGLVRRARKNSAPSAGRLTARRLLFEALEPRVLLSADPLGSTALTSLTQLYPDTNAAANAAPKVDVQTTTTASHLDHLLSPSDLTAQSAVVPQII